MVFRLSIHLDRGHLAWPIAAGIRNAMVEVVRLGSDDEVSTVKMGSHFHVCIANHAIAVEAAMSRAADRDQYLDVA